MSRRYCLEYRRESWKSSLARIIYNARASPPWKRNFEVIGIVPRIFYERKPSSFQIVVVVYFLESRTRKRLTKSLSLSLSRSTCPLTRITSQPVDYYHNAIFPFPWEGGGLKEGKYEVEWSSSVNKSVPVFIACRISLPGLALANEATRYIIFNGPSLRIKLYTTWMIYRSKRNDNRRIIAREADQPRTK